MERYKILKQQKVLHKFSSYGSDCKEYGLLGCNVAITITYFAQLASSFYWFLAWLTL
jgi:hypothetical protein